ncbi:hypothetical protein HPDFL43_08159 [Hoeflea phototrophica DFL-43]|jgi:hypothetical protein|uniref:PilZ domain-containing protein n=1 Tax=Hoeflea phototrophica (strain DSM 17068 / NCIMB 14078 / DFL-43) TaxID=411684 RepID=A9D9C1_HOEPD|nr:hypothetical protein [Hoeflea phototrophica]EDQ32907.2 hypothetical protein HPDFL43_08159 [Hoeflea phototrophica DFL-43]
MRPKRHALTQIGGAGDKRQVYSKQDANCPVIAHVSVRNSETRIPIPCWMVNLSEDSCLLTSDHFPPRVIDVYLVIPGLGAKVHAVTRNQGKFTLGLSLTTKIPSDLISKVARIKAVSKAAPVG